MNDHDFDAVARAALADSPLEAEPLPREAVWRQIRPEPKWLPSLKEIALATAVGAFVLAYLALPVHRPVEMVASKKAPQKPTVDQTYVALSATTFP